MRRPLLALLAIPVLLVLPTTAHADDADGITITFAQPNQTLEYGESWGFQAVAAPTYYGICDCPVYATMTGPTSVTPRVYSHLEETTNSTNITVSSPPDTPPLEPGDYVLTLRLPIFDPRDFPEPLTITPAKLNVEVRLASDPAAPGNAILSARLTGRFVDEFAYLGPARAPAGVWHLVIADSEGKTVFERDVERAEGGNDLAVTEYWTEAKPGGQYSATATFTASGISATRFSVAEGNEYPFTMSSALRPTPTSTASAPASAPDALPDAEQTSSTVPLPAWSAALVVLVLAGLTALLVVNLVRRRPKAAPPAAPAISEVEA